MHCNFDKTQHSTAAVSCSAITVRLGGVGSGVLVDGQAGKCMGRFMGGAWVYGGGGCVGGWGDACITEEHLNAGRPLFLFFYIFSLFLPFFCFFVCDGKK